MIRYAFLATRRTGNDPARHEMFELAVLDRGDTRDAEYVWRLRANRLPDADPAEIASSGYWNRDHYGHDVVRLDTELGTAAPVAPEIVAATVAEILFNRHLVSLNPYLEIGFVGAWLRRLGQIAAWRRPIDVTAMAAGAAAAQRNTSAAQQPWDALRLASDLGLPIGPGDRLSGARDDVMLARALWDHLHYGHLPVPSPMPAAVAAPGPSDPRDMRSNPYRDTPPAPTDTLTLPAAPQTSECGGV